MSAGAFSAILLSLALSIPASPLSSLRLSSLLPSSTLPRLSLTDFLFHEPPRYEEDFKFGHFVSPLLADSDFTAKPQARGDAFLAFCRRLHNTSPFLLVQTFSPFCASQVLLLGQYSTGKSTFIKHLLKRDYPGIHIGPEPTTDRFVVVMHGWVRAREERETGFRVFQPASFHLGRHLSYP